MHESIDGFAAKRPLTEVKEEPQHEKEDDFEMLDAPTRDLEGECTLFFRVWFAGFNLAWVAARDRQPY